MADSLRRKQALSENAAVDDVLHCGAIAQDGGQVQAQLATKLGDATRILATGAEHDQETSGERLMHGRRGTRADVSLACNERAVYVQCDGADRRRIGRGY